MFMHDDKFVTTFKALADKTRLDIVRNIALKPKDTASCHEVSTCSSLSQPAMSHHFKKLVDAGLLLERKSGTEKFYELNHELFASVGINPDKL
ncbi:hypothetical protein BH10PAT3_BH10PAT3_0250 [soil metagenome]